MPASPRPDSIGQAATLIFVAVALSLAATLYSWTVIGGNRLRSIPALFLSPLLLILWVIFTVFVLQRQNWARIGIAVLTVYSAMIVLTTIRLLSYGGAFSALALPWITFLLRIAAAYLLFTPQSNAWFSSARPGPALPNQNSR